jgi:hypothetical protein
MLASLFALGFAVVLVGDPTDGVETPHKPNPLAPSLPLLSEEEEKRLDEIIDRFIDYDSGKLRGPGARQAVADFQKLTPEAIPALIRGLNRAAHIEHSCPAVTIARKLNRMFRATRDLELLDFARENIGAGITQSRHLGVIKDLRITCLLRKNQVVQSGTAFKPGEALSVGGNSVGESAAPKELRSYSLTELLEAAGTEHESRLRAVLTELGRRHDEPVIGALNTAATNYETDVRQLARDLLEKQLGSLPEKELQATLKDDRPEVRAAAARAIGHKRLHGESALIDLLTDSDEGVRKDAHRALLRVTRARDLGPKAGADDAQRREAQDKWRTWLAKRGEH